MPQLSRVLQCLLAPKAWSACRGISNSCVSILLLLMTTLQGNFLISHLQTLHNRRIYLIILFFIYVYSGLECFPRTDGWTDRHDKGHIRLWQVYERAWKTIGTGPTQCKFMAFQFTTQKLQLGSNIYLSLSRPWRCIGGIEIQFHSFLTSAVFGSG